MKTPERNSDLRHVATDLPEAEIAEILRENKRLMQVRQLGSRYLLDPSNAPVKGVYNPLTGAKLK